MQAKLFKKYVNELDDDVEVVFSYMTKEEVEDWYNNGEKLEDAVWEILCNNLGWEGDEIQYILESATEDVEEWKQKWEQQQSENPK